MSLREEDEIRIAVLAVHGVSNHPSGGSARAVGNLLLNLDESGKPLYSFLRETALRIQTRAVQLARLCPACKTPVGSAGAKAAAEAECRRGNPFKRWVESRLTATEAEKGNSDCEGSDYYFLRGQLECYRGEDPDEPYETTRLEGRRKGDGEHVHIYEMFWADLSRFQNGFLRVFGEVYQILLHLPSIGVHTLRAAQLEHAGDRKWQALVGVHNLAAWLLSVPIALCNLLLLGLALGVAVAGTVSAMPVMAASLLIAALVGVAVYFVSRIFYRKGSQKAPVAAIAIGTFVFGMAGIFAVVSNKTDISSGTPAKAWLLIVPAACVAALTLLVRAYNKRRPSALHWWSLLLPSFLMVLIGSLLWKGVYPDFCSLDHQLPAHIFYWHYLLRGIEVAIWLMVLFWIIFQLSAATALVVGRIAIKSEVLDKRARRTAELTLCLPAVLFTFLSFAVWAAVASATSPLIPTEHLAYQPIFLPAMVAKDAGWDLLTYSALLTPVLGVFAIAALLILIVGLTPVLVNEMSPPARVKEAPLASKQLGNWLSAGNSAAVWSARILFFAIAVAMPLCLPFLLSESLRIGLHDKIGPFMAQLGKVIAGPAIGLFALRRTFDKLAKSLAPLDALLDVDNYMREHPREQNPTARIFARYASVLRAICEWRDPVTGKPYDALVIVAHSQGTVITADLLRFLHSEKKKYKGTCPTTYDSRIDRLLSKDLPVWLFTMGCPLRHLYGRRFPHLYGYAWHGEVTSMNQFTPPDLIPARNPDPEKLGVRQWVNAFRSGDYVGRFLWRSDACTYAWLPPVSEPADTKRPWDVNKMRAINVSEDEDEDGKVTRREFCIGPGAHTHYWDDTAPEIACELDRLITAAAASVCQERDLKVSAREVLPA